MTRNSDFKRSVRERMAKTGERYTTARRQLLGAETAPPKDGVDPTGIDAATTAFRILLEAAGLRLSEGDLLLAGGGIGIGIFSFTYPEFSSLFIAGRHLWHDDLAFLEDLAGRLGVKLEVRETGSRKRALIDLNETLEAGPVIAFVDLATLAHRGGMEAYYVVTILEVDDDRGVALIADLADKPTEVPLDRLAEARARHKKFKNRLVRVESVPSRAPTDEAIGGGLRACATGLVESPMKGFGTNFTLDSLALLAKRMRGDGKESWAQVFPPGRRLWTALASIYEYVEHYGSGGGLLRPFFAESLASAGLGAKETAAAYSALGESWSEFARSALDPQVQQFADLAQLIDDSYGVYDSLGPDAEAELAKLREKRRAITSGEFPLSAVDASRLVEELADRVEGLESGEREARGLLERVTR